MSSTSPAPADSLARVGPSDPGLDLLAGVGSSDLGLDLLTGLGSPDLGLDLLAGVRSPDLNLDIGVRFPDLGLDIRVSPSNSGPIVEWGSQPRFGYRGRPFLIQTWTSLLVGDFEVFRTGIRHSANF